MEDLESIYTKYILLLLKLSRFKKLDRTIKSELNKQYTYILKKNKRKRSSKQKN